MRELCGGPCLSRGTLELRRRGRADRADLDVGVGHVRIRVLRLDIGWDA